MQFNSCLECYQFQTKEAANVGGLASRTVNFARDQLLLKSLLCFELEQIEQKCSKSINFSLITCLIVTLKSDSICGSFIDEWRLKMNVF